MAGLGDAAGGGQGMLLRKFAACTLSFLLVALLAASPASAGAERFSGEELFRGLFFGRGPVAALITDDSAELIPLELLWVESLVIAEVQRAAPSLFDDLEALLQSGDPEQVDAGLRLAGSALADAAAEVTGVSKEGLALQNPDQNACIDIFLAYFIVFGILLDYAVQYEVYYTSGLALNTSSTLDVRISPYVSTYAYAPSVDYIQYQAEWPGESPEAQAQGGVVTDKFVLDVARKLAG